jgi:tRNA/rRNA methyltransferase
MKNHPVIILVEPQLGENIGMAARAMANFGFHEMRIVNPRENWLNQKTIAAAAGAGFIVEGARLFPSVKDAIADLHCIYATTARERGQGKPVHGPDEAARILTDHLRDDHKVGILFGRERTGLENEDIALADAICTFPVDPDFASLNLSQAVLLMSYSLRIASDAGAILPFSNKTKWPPATREALSSFFDYLDEKLDERGFYRPASKKPRMSLNLHNILMRIGMDEQDLRTLRGMIVRLVEGPRKPYSKKAKREAEKTQTISSESGSE